MKSFLCLARSTTAAWKVPLFFTGLFVLYVCSPNYVNTNQYSRFGLTQAIVEHGSFQIDPYVRGVDWSRRDGHYYTNKAPGSAMLGVPFYLLLYSLELAVGSNPAELREFNLDLTDWFVTALPSVLASLFLLKYLLLRNPKAPGGAWLAVFALSLGTIMFPFSTALWGHPTAAAFLFLAFYALVVKGSGWLTGLFLGMAVLVEYSAALTIPFFLGYHVWKEGRKSIRGLWHILISGAPSLILFLWYHKTCFGGWLTMPSVYQNPYFGLQSNQRMFHVLALPDPEILWKLLFGTERGLFLISPVLLLAIPGFWALLKERRDGPKLGYRDAELAIALPLVLVFWLFNASFVGWRAGWSSGPRYMIPMLPFLVLGLARCRVGFWYHWLLYLSVLNCAAIMAVTTTSQPGLALLIERIYPSLEEKVFVLLPILAGVAGLFAISQVGCGKTPGGNDSGPTEGNEGNDALEMKQERLQIAEA